MATELTNQSEQTGTLTTWRRLYLADWEQGFNEFMMILAQQYKIELMIQIGNKKQPSPVIQFWREGIRGLSPSQMMEGLRGWQKTESGGFQPTPEDIAKNGEGFDAPNDKPIRKTKPDCEACDGTGLKAADGRMYRDWNGRDKFSLVSCDCAVVVYKGQEYRSAPLQLRAAPEAKALPAVNVKNFPVHKAAKSSPPRQQLSEAEYEQHQNELRQQAEKLKGSHVD